MALVQVDLYHLSSLLTSCIVEVSSIEGLSAYTVFDCSSHFVSLTEVSRSIRSELETWSFRSCCWASLESASEFRIAY